MLKMALAAEGLDIRAVEIARADGLVGQAVHVLEQVQRHHQPGRQPRPARPFDVERTEPRLEERPVDQPRQPHQGMPLVDDILKARAK